MDPLDHVHVAIVGHAHRLADGQDNLRQQGDGVDHQQVALPMADGVAVEGQVGIVRMAAAVGVDAAQAIAVHLAQQGDAAGGVQHLKGVAGDQHQAGHALRQAVQIEVVRVARLVVGVHPGGDARGVRRPRRRRLGELRHLVGQVGGPDAAPVRQLGQGRPGGGGRRPRRRAGGQGRARERRGEDQGGEHGGAARVHCSPGRS